MNQLIEDLLLKIEDLSKTDEENRNPYTQICMDIGKIIDSWLEVPYVNGKENISEQEYVTLRNLLLIDMNVARKLQAYWREVSNDPLFPKSNAGNKPSSLTGLFYSLVKSASAVNDTDDFV